MKSHRSYHYEPVVQLDGYMCINPGEKPKDESDKGQDYEYNGDCVHLRSIVGIEVDTWIGWSCERHACFLILLNVSRSERKKEEGISIKFAAIVLNPSQTKLLRSLGPLIAADPPSCWWKKGKGTDPKADVICVLRQVHPVSERRSQGRTTPRDMMYMAHPSLLEWHVNSTIGLIISRICNVPALSSW